MNPISIQKKSLRILIIDDDELMRLKLYEILEEWVSELIVASDGKEGLSAYIERQPHLVLLDSKSKMPLMDGFTCCRQIKNLAGSDRIPILMMMDLEDFDLVELAFEAGATDYVTKPINPAILHQRVKTLIQQSHLSREQAYLCQKQSQLYQHLERVNHSLKDLFSVDSLTELATRRRFDEYLDREWRRMLRNQNPLSLILGDIDYFKAYNDAYGYLAGDECLKQVAKAINSAAQRSADLVARYGGEEFGLILPMTEASGAIAVAEKIISQVKALEIAHHTSIGNQITLSLGIATTIPAYDSSPEILVATAVNLLDQAKKLGRDRFIFSYDS